MGNQPVTRLDTESSPVNKKTDENNLRMMVFPEKPPLNSSRILDSGQSRSNQGTTIITRPTAEDSDPEGKRLKVAFRNIRQVNPGQFVVELADESLYIGSLKNSTFEGYGEIDWKKHKKR